LGLPVGTYGEPYRARPIATYALIAANVIVYLITAGPNMLVATSNYWIRVTGFSPLMVFVDPGQIYRLFTSMFVHADIFHIFFNMYFLYMFGRAVENTLGSARFLVLYLASGVMAAVFHSVFSFLQGVDALVIPAVGASGAISGVLGAYTILYPGTRLTACFFMLVPVCYTTSAIYFLLFWFALQVFYGYASMGTVIATVAFFAHAGGFLAGIALLPVLADYSRIYLLRATSETTAQLFGGLIVLPQLWRRLERGLSGAAKTVFALLILALVAGTAVALLASTSKPLLVSVAKVRATLEGYAPSEGYVVFQQEATGAEIVTTSILLLPDEVRILVNRLYYADILYNPMLAGQEVYISNKVLEARIEVCDRVVPVKVLVKELWGRYGSGGLLVEADGVIESPVIIVVRRLFICIPRIGETLEMRFEVAGLERIDLSPLMLSPAAVSLLISVLALYTVAARDKDLVVTPM
jgi:membrane associated rhomboid family serine protease